MSDRVTNIEIEDVLSSIRKLVADGEWIRQRAAEASAAKGVEANLEVAEPVDETGKFVLTPALRVIESRAESRGKPESSLRFRRSAEPEVANNDVVWTDDTAPAETNEPEVDAAPEIVTEPIIEAPVMDDDEAEEASQAAPETISDILEMIDAESEDDQATGEEDDDTSYHSLGAAIAELEAAVGSEAEEWEPDGSEIVLSDLTTPLRVVGAQPMPDIVDDETGWNEPQPEMADAAPDEEQVEAASAPLDLAFFARPRESFAKEEVQIVEAEDLSEIEEPEVAFTSVEFAHADPEEAETALIEEEEEIVFETAEPLETFAEEPEAALSEVGPEEQASVEELEEITETIVEAAMEETMAAIDEDLSAYLSEDLPLDEDALRALLAEVVRAELEGELGEKITRNIRKLVRREIFQVLESRGM